MDFAEFQALKRRIERQVPIKARVHARLCELNAELAEFAESVKRENRYHTTEEWKEFRKKMRFGMRIARRFGDERIKIFKTMFDTATTYLRGSGIAV